MPFLPKPNMPTNLRLAASSPGPPPGQRLKGKPKGGGCFEDTSVTSRPGGDRGDSRLSGAMLHGLGSNQPTESVLKFRNSSSENLNTGVSAFSVFSPPTQPTKIN